MLHSNYRELCAVDLPFKNRQLYMHTFSVANPQMAEGFDDYRESVVKLLRNAGMQQGIAYMTVDEKIIEAGMSQRRPKPHVDGCFVPAMSTWGHGGWNHYCNNIASGKLARMAVIVASSIPGCKVWRGLFEGQPKNDGDLSHIADQLGGGEVLPAGMGYLLNPDCVHESMVFTERTQRTFLRIAFAV